jgi:hypothetical protein
MLDAGSWMLDVAEDRFRDPGVGGWIQHLASSIQHLKNGR